MRATNLELAVPGTYAAGEPVVPITSFVPTLHVITSKAAAAAATLWTLRRNGKPGSRTNARLTPNGAGLSQSQE